MIRDYIRSVLVDSSVQKHKTIEASRYMLLNDFGGLQRPLLLLATTNGYSITPEKALPIATSIEFVHVASLIEDDMMDKSDMRRGKPACHKVFGEPISHLAQMYLIQCAHEQIISKNSLSDSQRLAIAKRAHDTGKYMVLGQERDVTQIGLKTPEDIVRMYERKSGSLIGLALAAGGIIGGACEEDIEALNRMGVKAGVGYQIIDDALDERASEKETGKPRGQDVNKKTLIKLVGWDGVRKMKNKIDSEVDRLYGTLHGDQSLLMDLIIHIRHKHDNNLK